MSALEDLAREKGAAELLPCSPQRVEDQNSLVVRTAPRLVIHEERLCPLLGEWLLDEEDEIRYGALTSVPKTRVSDDT